MLWCTVDNVLAPTLTVRCKTAPWCFTRRGWRPSFTRWSTMIRAKYNSSTNANTNTNTTHLSFTRWSTVLRTKYNQRTSHHRAFYIVHCNNPFLDHKERDICSWSIQNTKTCWSFWVSSVQKPMNYNNLTIYYTGLVLQTLIESILEIWVYDNLEMLLFSDKCIGLVWKILFEIHCPPTQLLFRIV